MKKILLLIIMLTLIIFGYGCSIDFQQQLEITQAEPYVCNVGEQLPFTNIEFDEETNVLEKTFLGVFAINYGEVLINSEQGYYHIIVKEVDPSFQVQTKQLLTIGEKTKLLVSVLPLNNNQDIEFESYDPSIIAVTDNGEITAMNEGVTRVKITNKVNNIEKEITYIVLETDEKYYETMIDLIINNKEIELDADFNNIINGVMDCNKSSLIGVSTYKMVKNHVVESDFGSGIIYKMNVIYNDGTIIYDVKSAKDVTNIENILTFEYYVITNRHLIYDKYKTKIYIGKDKNEIEAQVLEYDDKIDLAVLKFSSKVYFPIAKLGDSETVQKGEFIISIGNGTGKEYFRSGTFGSVSSNKRYVNSDTNADGMNDWDSEYIQHDASINECDSGGAVLNLKGEVIGINSTKISSLTFNNMSFAIPINLVMEIVSQLEQGIRPQRAVLVVQIFDVTAYHQNTEYHRRQIFCYSTHLHLRCKFRLIAEQASSL